MGRLYRSQLHGNRGREVEQYKGHHGPITAIHYHPAGPGGVSNSLVHLALTSSVDWTVKLWSQQLSELEAKIQPIQTLASASTDYMYATTKCTIYVNDEAFVCCPLLLVMSTVMSTVDG
jgi:hypothetical protein